MAAILAQNDELETGKRALAERLSAHEAAAASHQTELDAMAATQAALRCDREAIARGLAAAQQEAARRRREEASLKERNAGLAEQIALDSEQLGRLRQGLARVEKELPLARRETEGDRFYEVRGGLVKPTDESSMATSHP